MLKEKVSRERIAKEYKLMVCGLNPIQAIRLLAENDFLRFIFVMPEDVNQEAVLARGLSIVNQLSELPPLNSEDSLLVITSALILGLTDYGTIPLGTNKRTWLTYYAYVL
jgi:tRNA nucleotidyltransferase/poly(A) polymerase